MKKILGIARLLKFVVSHPENSQKKCRAILRLLIWQLYKRTISEPIVINIEERKFIAVTDSMYSSLVVYAKYPDWLEFDFIKHNLNGNIFIDVGANVGYFSVFASNFTEAKKIYAFEPNRKNFAVLKNQMALNNLADAQLFELAIGNESGSVTFSDSHREKGHVLRNGDGEVVVSIKKLDDIFAHLELSSAIVKIDIEGGELDALRGATKTLSRGVIKFIIFEVNREGMVENDCNTTEVINFLEDHGYIVCLWSEKEKRLIESDVKIDGANSTNYIAKLANK